MNNELIKSKFDSISSNIDKILQRIDKIHKKYKKKYGQFYTTNYNYILQNLSITSETKIIIEPFVGNGDLLKFIKKRDNYIIEKYDINPKIKDINEIRDTIKNPPSYKNKFILTNPPWLARNESQDKSLFDKYHVNDLYKCLIKELITNSPIGGILIIPLNFWSSIRKSDVELRKLFLDKFSIIHLNIFEEQIFDDTSYTSCSFQFEIKKNKKDNAYNKIKIQIYPSNKKLSINLNNKNNYTFGGDIYNLKQNTKFKIMRLTKNNIESEKKYITNILVKCIDDNSNSKIRLNIVAKNNRYIDETENLSARSYATLIINPILNKEKQKKLVKEFNIYLNKKRDECNSLFLTNYRESKDIDRKRISFKLVYQIVNYLLNEMNHS